jgi:hypothetical protein
MHRRCALYALSCIPACFGRGCWNLIGITLGIHDFYLFISSFLILNFDAFLFRLPRHDAGFLMRQVEHNLNMLQHNLQNNEEINFELFHCLVFNMGDQENSFPDSNFQTEDQRTNWEREACLFLRGTWRKRA